MFPFSSLFTQVPLMILAAAYMLYFGAYALGKSKENITESQQEQKEQSVIIKADYSSDNTFYYSSASEVTQNAAEPEKRLVTYLRFYIPVQYFDPDRKICSSFNSYNFFARPPPTQS